MFDKKSKATIKATVRLNGAPIKIRPDLFTVYDGDDLVVDVDVDFPFVQREDTVGDVLIVREVIRPVVE